MPKTMATGSVNPPKVHAVRRAILSVWPDAAQLPLAVDSGVSVIPADGLYARDEEGMRTGVWVWRDRWPMSCRACVSLTGWRS